MKVVIEKWYAVEDYVHCHLEDNKSIHARVGDVVPGVTVERFVAIGLSCGDLRQTNTQLFTDDCRSLCNLVEAVVGYSSSDLETARNQLSDSGFVGQLTDDEVAFLDYKARESWIDEARCIDDPWKSTQHLQSNASEFILDEHLESKSKVS